MKKCTKSILSVFLAFAAVLAVCAGAVTAHALTYSGKGTVKDPYLVTTAEQLQGMRENLSAHYKLAANVDLSGMDFKPIGRLDNPFTGSFTCELNADKTPKYIIKGLTQHILDSEYVAEFKNKWEGGLFGCVDGATVYGIYILDANIVNDKLGDNRGAVVYGNYKPGMDEMATGILIGEARNAAISNCGTTGNVGGKASHCAGLVGSAKSCTIDNCYSTARVNTAGKWHVGGLIGIANDSQITSCFSTGEVTGGAACIAAFVGSAGNTAVTDCYATGNVINGHATFSSWAGLQDGGAKGSVFTNCIALGTAVNAGSAEEGDTVTITNCYALSGTEGANTSFTYADIATMKTKITGSNWSWNGDAPVLVNIGVVTDASKYFSVPAPTEAPTTKPTEAPATAPTQGTTAPTQGTIAPTQGTTAPTQGTTAPTQGTTAPTQGTTAPTQGTMAPTQGTAAPTQDTAAPTQATAPTETEPVPSETENTVPVDTQPATQPQDELTAQKVAELIGDLPDPEIEEIYTLEDKAAVQEAFNGYEALGAGDKDDFSPALYSKLMKARYQVSLLLASDLFDRVAALPETDGLDASHAAAAQEICADYNFLDSALKEAYDASVIEKIEAINSWLAENPDPEAPPAAEVPGADAGISVSAELTAWDWALVIGSSIVIVLVISFNICAGIYQIRRAKNSRTASETAEGEDEEDEAE